MQPAEDTILAISPHLQLALEAGKIGSYELDLNSGKIKCTTQCKKNFGIESADSLTYTTFRDMILHEDRAHQTNIFQNAIANNNIYDAEYRIVWSDGSQHWIHAVGHPIYNDNGKVIKVSGVTVDITERKLAELKSLENEAKAKYLLSDAPIPIGIFIGRELIIESANDKMLQLWGKTNSIISKPLHIGLPELEGQPFLKILDNVFTSGEPFYGNEVKANLVHNHILQDFYFNFVYHPLKNKEGQVFGIMVIATDVTEQLKSRKKIEQAEESLRMATDAAGLATYNINIQTRVFTTSPRLKEFFGFHPHEEVPYEAAIGQIHEDYRQAAADLVEAAITKGVRFDMEYPVIGHHNGEARWVRGIGTLQNDSNGVDSFFTGVLHDITERRLDDQRKNDFIAMVSHELKTPLTSLKGYIQLLKIKSKDVEDPFVLSALYKANNQVDKMSDMIKGFLDVARIEGGKIHLDIQPFQIKELIDEAIEEVSSIAMRAHSIVSHACEDFIVVGDRSKIEQVINNLLSNAIKYSPKADSIEITCEAIDGMLQIGIKDKGMGIKPKDIKKLFERFYRVESDHTKEIGGFGVGLYICSEIISRHKGKLWVESEYGNGSTFYFTLPLKEH
jgi:two-component system sensor histidine kinase VicK